MTLLYCGSFNPLHIGHLAILRHLCTCEEVSRVLLVVSPKNPLKENISCESAKERFEAAQAALSRHPELAPKVQISDIELNMPAPHYTIRTLEKLAQEEPGETFALVTGGDQLADIRRWKEYEEILLRFGLWVYPRPGFDSQSLRAELLQENPAYRITLLKGEEINISSTEIRNGLSTPDCLM